MAAIYHSACSREKAIHEFGYEQSREHDANRVSEFESLARCSCFEIKNHKANDIIFALLQALTMTRSTFIRAGDTTNCQLNAIYLSRVDMEDKATDSTKRRLLTSECFHCDNSASTESKSMSAAAAEVENQLQLADLATTLKVGSLPLGR